MYRDDASSLEHISSILIYLVCRLLTRNIVTGESYAGMYVPYIASGMLDQKDKTYFNVQGIQINDPSINFDETMLESTIPNGICLDLILTKISSFRPCAVTLPKWFVT